MSSELKAANERLLAEVLSDVSDAGVRADLEKRFRSRLKAKEDRAEGNEAVFNAAFGKALSLGIDDPHEYAERAVKLAFMEGIHAIKVAAVRKAPVHMATNAADRAAVAAEAASRTANPTQRRNQQRDREYLEIIGSAERGGRLSTPGLVGGEIEKKLGRYRLPHWEKTTLPLKVAALSLETEKRGGRTINLRIGDTFSKKALGSSRGPVSFMQNQVRETLKRRFAADAPEFWFVMERDSDDLFHLHGAYVDQRHVGHGLVDAALRDAGGWSSPKGKGRAHQSAELKDPLYWASYVIKQMNLTSTLTDRKLLASTAELRDAARGAWDGWRSRLPGS